MLFSTALSRKITQTPLLGQFPFKITLILNRRAKESFKQSSNLIFESNIHTLTSFDRQNMLCISACYSAMGLIRKVMGMPIALF